MSMEYQLMLESNLGIPDLNPYFATKAFWVVLGQSHSQTNLPDKFVNITWKREGKVLWGTKTMV